MSAVFWFLPVMGAFLLHAQGEEPTRAAFAQAMGAVTKDMKADEVVKLLGKPGDIRTEFDPGGIPTYQTTEIWGYGTAGHLSFPTLGCVYMTEGRVQYVFGGKGTPPDPAMFDEAELRKLLRLIDSASGREKHNPLRLIQIVNTLQPLGREKALAAIGEYLRVEPEYTFEKDMQVFLILRLLFEVPADPGFMPRMMVGGPSVAEPRNHKLLPLFPLVLLDDIPLNLVTGYMLAGQAQRVEDHIEYFQKNGEWSGHPLLPSDNPLGVLDMLEHSPQWIYPGKTGSNEYDYAKKFLANQLLRLIDTVYRIEPDEHEDRLPGNHFDQPRWDKIVKDVTALHIKWDAAKNIYVFADGTSLPEIRNPIYMRQIWEIPGLGPAAKLIIERKNKDWIFVILQHNEYQGVFVPESTVKVYCKGSNNKPLAEYHIPFSPGGDASHQTCQDVKLSADESLQAEITSGDKTTKSAVFTP